VQPRPMPSLWQDHLERLWLPRQPGHELSCSGQPLHLPLTLALGTEVGPRRGSSLSFILGQGGGTRPSAHGAASPASRPIRSSKWSRSADVSMDAQSRVPPDRKNCSGDSQSP
jgi:hypothetical protein